MLWTKPWTFKEGTAISLGLLLVGELLQLSVGSVEWGLLAWPANIILLVLLVLALVAVFFLRDRVYVFRFLTTAYAAVPSIGSAALLTVVMGLTRQVAAGAPAADPIGISRMLSFWPFVLSYLWMTVIVGELTIVQLSRFSWRQLPSLLSHAGLFLVLACGTLGSADMQRLKMYCSVGQVEWRGLDDAKNMHELPVAIELQQFTIDEYPPKLVVVDSKGLPLPEPKRPQEMHLDAQTKTGHLMGWTLTVEQTLADAAPVSLAMMHGAMPEGMMSMVQMDSLGMKLNRGGFVAWDKTGSAYAVLVRAVRGREQRRGWITCGSYLFPYQGLQLDTAHTVVMPQREPKRYASRIRVLTKDGQNVETTVEVNKPYTVGGWKIYQLSYDEQMGKWSNTSVFELVTDPWLPAVYAGIFMLLGGAILMFIFAGRKK